MHALDTFMVKISIATCVATHVWLSPSCGRPAACISAVAPNEPPGTHCATVAFPSNENGKCYATE